MSIESLAKIKWNKNIDWYVLICMDVKAAMGFLERFREGDASAFEEIVRAHQDRIYNLCRYMLGNARDAEDAAQDAFIKAFRNLKDFEPAPSFSAWLYRIAVNTCIDYRRKTLFLSFFRVSPEGKEFPIEPRSVLPLTRCREGKPDCSKVSL